MAALPWITYLQRMVGRGHPTLADTLNTPLRELLTQSGYDPDSVTLDLWRMTTDGERTLVIGIDFAGPPRVQVGSNLAPEMLEMGYGANDAFGPALLFLKARGVLPAAVLPILLNDVLGDLQFQGVDSAAGGGQIGAQIKAQAGENWNVAAHGAHLTFWTTPLGGGGGPTQRWQVEDAGHWSPIGDNLYLIGSQAARVLAVFTNRVQFSRSAPTYGVNVAINSAAGEIFQIVPTDGVAFTIGAPSQPPSSPQTQRLTIRIKNTFGTLGVATFTGGAGGYRLGASWTQPANGFSRSIGFEWDGTNWIEVSRSSADVTN